MSQTASQQDQRDSLDTQTAEGQGIVPSPSLASVDSPTQTGNMQSTSPAAAPRPAPPQTNPQDPVSALLRVVP